MRLLITTPLEIILLDVQSGRSRLIRAGEGGYGGVSWNTKALVVAQTGMNVEVLQTHDDYRSHICGYLQLWDDSLREKRTATELLAAHQIECIGDMILAANTGRNCLSLFDADGVFLRHAYLTDKHWDLEADGTRGDHFNSVHYAGEKLWVVAHGGEAPSSLWQLSWPDLRVIDVIRTSARWAHNVWLGEYGPVICNSADGGLLAVSSDETLWRPDESPIFTRGLAVSDDYIVIGRSEYGSRSERRRSDGGVWIVDRKTLKTLDLIRLPGSGVVGDIRLLEGRDECHNGEPFNFKWLRLSGQVRLSTRIQFELRKARPLYESASRGAWKLRRSIRRSLPL